MKEVRAPDLVYKDRLTITLGGKSVELIYTGNMTHTDDMSIIRFPDASAIFVVDWISPGRLPFATLGTGMLDAWFNAIRLAEALEYDIATGCSLADPEVRLESYPVAIENGQIVIDLSSKSK